LIAVILRGFGQNQGSLRPGLGVTESLVLGRVNPRSGWQFGRPVAPGFPGVPVAGFGIFLIAIVVPVAGFLVGLIDFPGDQVKIIHPDRLINIVRSHGEGIAQLYSKNP
jgi:hypothetical protein